MNDQEKLHVMSLALKEVKGKEVANLSRETLVSDLDLDSLDLVEIQLFFEAHLETVIKDPNKPIRTVGDLFDLVP